MITNTTQQTQAFKSKIALKTQFYQEAAKLSEQVKEVVTKDPSCKGLRINVPIAEGKSPSTALIEKFARAGVSKMGDKVEFMTISTPKAETKMPPKIMEIIQKSPLVKWFETES